MRGAMYWLWTEFACRNDGNEMNPLAVINIDRMSWPWNGNSKGMTMLAGSSEWDVEDKTWTSESSVVRLKAKR